jgi:uncharacterized protein YaaN involved in tellurite resistance
MNFPRRRQPTIRQLIVNLTRKVDRMAATLEDVTTALTTLTTDLEALATTAQAEFAKLESEVAAGTPVNLDPLKEAVDALDTRVKAAVIPSA